MMEKISTLNMSREEWLEHRRHSIGGSDAATIVGLNPWSSPYELWADKLGKIPPKEENEAMRIGHDLEEYVAKRFCEATGKKVRRENSILRDPKLPFAHANVDRLIIGEKAGLECKTTSVLNLKRFAGGEYPANYYVQCQHYMMVTGYDTWYLAVLVLGREFLHFEVKRNEEDIEALMQAEKDFWELVENRQEPAVDGTSSCSDTLDKLYPDSDPDVEIDLSPLTDALTQRSEICKQIKALEEQKKACENSIKDYMETAEKGRCEGYKVSWKTQQRIAFDSKQLQADHPEIDFSKYCKTTSSRIMSREEQNTCWKKLQKQMNGRCLVKTADAAETGHSKADLRQKAQSLRQYERKRSGGTLHGFQAAIRACRFRNRSRNSNGEQSNMCNAVKISRSVHAVNP